MAGPADPLSPTVLAPLEGPDGQKLTSVQEGAELVAGRYEVLGMLGSGAMGTVYRARDRELDEVVALKVLNKSLATTPGMIERFKREVKLARRVTHKNVARTFDIGEHEGDRFLTMEFVEGDMLATRLARAGTLSPAEAIAFARDVCSGLAAAHDAGVLHRDLKPENVIVARAGHAVITDFGIARALADDELHRTGGLLVGTPAYMAPEQVEGAADLDGRADLYALGAMLFELLTGAPPWTGGSVIAVAAARLLRPPPDPRAVAPELPADLAGLVLKLLARNRDDRFANAVEAGRALGSLARLGSAPSTPPPRPKTQPPPQLSRALAVLPLLNLGTLDDAYLAQSLTEDIVDLLSVVPELRVRPRGDTSRFESPHRDAREIGRALGVDVVVDGSVRRTGDDVRVAVRLVAVADGFQLWARRFDRRANEVLSVADAAAAAITRAVTSRDVTAGHAATVDPQAQDLYLRGRYFLHRAWYESISRDAVHLLREARARAPGDARIAGTLALALARSFGLDSPAPELAREARTAAEDALRVAPDQGEAHVARGLLHLYQNEVSAAAIELREALERAPNNVEALDAMGRMQMELGRVREGLALLTRALAVEPEFAGLKNHRARGLAFLGEWDAVDEELSVAPEHPGDLASYLIIKARLLLWRGGRAEAITLLRESLDKTLSPTAKRTIAAILQIASTPRLSDDDKQELQRHLPLETGQSARRAAFNAQMRAEMLLGSGAHDEALAVLGVADANGFFDLAWLEHCPLLAPVRDRPEYARIHASVALRAGRALDAIDR